MRKNYKLVLAVATSVFGAGVPLFSLQAGQNPPVAPVTLRYTHQMNRWGNESAEPTFWATNHSDKTLGIALRTIEIQTNGAWVTYSQIPLSGQLFFPTNQGNPGPVGSLLAPHAAGLCSLLYQHLILPTNAVWRVTGTVSEELKGKEAVAAAIKYAPLMSEARRAGNTNVPINSVSTDVTYMGHHSTLVSEPTLPY